MSSFRDTFTKEEKKENLLDYDDSAFLFFGGTVLISVLIPWTWRVLTSFKGKVKQFGKSSDGSQYRYCQCSRCVIQVENMKKDEQRWTKRFSWHLLLEAVIVGILWAVFAHVAYLCTQTRQIQTFDPFEILGISPGATDKEIKKAWRILSLKFHPDKNPNDPTAEAKFIRISKAHQSLTDEISKKNFEKYGNPDGPGVMKVGIGLPRILVDEQYQLFFLLLFFIILLVILPLIFILYYQRQKRFAQNGVHVETLQFLSYYMSEGTRMKNGPEFLAASGESRELALRPSDDKEMKPLINEVVEPRKRQFARPIIVRNYFLILGHMQRLHHLISDPLKEDLNIILSKSCLIIQSMIEIALMSNWLFCAQSMLEFERAIIHGLGFRNSSLLQIPHYDDEMLKHTLKGKKQARELKEFIRQSPEDRKVLNSRMNQAQLADVSAFCSHVSDMAVEAKVYVDDEKEMVVADVATVHVTMTRLNLQDGEAIGPIHAPLYPDTKFEQWWICLSDKSNGALLGFAHTRSVEKVIEEKIQFQLRKAGKIELQLSCHCDSYSGIDAIIDLSCKVFTEKEVKREIVVHPEDEALDNEPTLFQQLMGQLEQAGDDSSDEEEGEEKEKAINDATAPTREETTSSEETQVKPASGDNESSGGGGQPDEEKEESETE